MAQGSGARTFTVVMRSGEEITLKADRYSATKDPAVHSFFVRNELVAAFGVDQVIGAFEVANE